MLYIFILLTLELFERIYLYVYLTSTCNLFFFAAEELAYSLASDTADQSNLVHSLANNVQTPAQPAASSDLIASDNNVYYLADVEEDEYENLEAMERYNTRCTMQVLTSF